MSQQITTSTTLSFGPDVTLKDQGGALSFALGELLTQAEELGGSAQRIVSFELEPAGGINGWAEPLAAAHNLTLTTELA